MGEVTPPGHFSDGLVGLGIAVPEQSLPMRSAHAMRSRQAVAAVDDADGVHAAAEGAIGKDVAETDPAQVVGVTPAAFGRDASAPVDGAVVDRAGFWGSSNADHLRGMR
jgi:hypothetical protein